MIRSLQLTGLGSALSPTSRWTHESIYSDWLKVVLLSCALLFVSQRAHSAPLSLLYDFSSYADDAFVTDDPTWTTNDQWQNNGIISGTPTGKAGWLGGLYSDPTTPTAVLKLAFDPKDNSKFTFRWVQNIANAASDDGKRDTFGWSVYSTTGASLLSLKYTYGNYTGTDGRNYDTRVSGYLGDLNGTSASNFNLGLLNRGEYVSFQVEVDTSANQWSAGVSSYSSSNPNAPISNNLLSQGNLNAAAGTQVGGIGAVWDLADKTPTTNVSPASDGSSPNTFYNGSGMNIMTIDNLSVQGIPEPSSLSLLGLGGLALLSLQRRRQS